MCRICTILMALMLVLGMTTSVFAKDHHSAKNYGYIEDPRIEKQYIKDMIERQVWGNIH